ncbi:MAG: hypothetical protein S4CHLAM81_10750 [Chlamydiales bacterium]|nr:hypothetical protein [Chlamydiales bacterium]MCH9635853.1 hypothetical protein [Chlamydiales bacterium]MCH9703574.1 DUF721 domain-containing protein [Chlamydiota bacterium]
MVSKWCACTSKHIRDVLPNVMSNIGKVFKDRPDLIVEAWPEVVGSRLAPQARAVAFADGFLQVRVQNSTLLSLLTQDRSRIVQNLRAKFPKTTIKSVVFRLE